MSNSMSKSTARRRGDRQREARLTNCKEVINKESHIPCSPMERQQYVDQMTRMYKNTQIPAVVYKGDTIPRRMLSEYSFYTKG